MGTGAGVIAAGLGACLEVAVGGEFDSAVAVDVFCVVGAALVVETVGVGCESGV